MSIPHGRIAIVRLPGTSAAKPAVGVPTRSMRPSDGGRDPPRARVVDVVSVQRHEALVRGDSERGPGRQPEVRVHDVEALAGVAAAQVARGAQIGARTTRSERMHADVEAVDALQREDLVAHEVAQRGAGGRRVHVRDDERAHGAGGQVHRVGTASRESRCRRVWIRHAAVRSIGATPNPTAGRPRMPYRTMGWIHANIARLWREQTGQGTVEYVGLMLLLATLLTGVVAAASSLKGGGIAQEVVKTLKSAISDVGKAK